MFLPEVVRDQEISYKLLNQLNFPNMKVECDLWYAITVTEQIKGASMRIPSRVVLPFGYRISVRQLSDSEMDRRDPNADGIWDDELKTIYLRKKLPVTRRRYILAHELGHAWLDWQHRHLDNGKAKT